MLEHPAVGQVSVIGVPDERLGEVGAAFVVAAPTGPPDLGELAEWCKKEMANYKVPRYFWIIDELPLNPSNKVLKTDLRDRAAALLS
jgi:acyl-CoA synthetase (AMP-forming)/AMP-acid ligase II